MKLPQQPTIPNTQNIISWLKFQSPSQLENLESVNKTSKKNPLFWCYWLKNLVCVDPNELHGTGYVSKELEKSSLVTASVTTFANWWNAFTTLPFLIFMFDSMGILTWPIAVLANIGLIKLGNALATGAASNQPISIRFARIGSSGFIAINLILTITSGVGSELLLNQSGLSRKLGEQLVQESIFEPLEKEISDIQNNETLEKTRNRCDTLERKLERLPRNDPKRDELYLAAHGPYADRFNLGGYSYYENKDIEQWPACPKANKLEAIRDNDLKVPKEKYQQKIKEVKNYGSDLAYLKAVRPKIYDSRFNEKGEIKSGTEATRVAIVLFTKKLFSLQWADLGQSLFVMSISVITSTVAIWITISYSKREDVQLSKSTAVINARDVFINETISSLDNNQADMQEMDKKLLRGFFSELRRTGKCNYPPFVKYVKFARDIEKSQHLRDNIETVETAVEQIKNGFQQLTDSTNDPENTAANDAKNLIHQGCDSIILLALEYFQTESRVKELIKTIQYVQGYLQHSHVNQSLATRQIGYLQELLTSSINLGDRLKKAIQKKYNTIIGNH